MAKMGRPRRIQITPEIVERVSQLAYIGMRDNDIASLVGLSESTMKSHFQSLLVKKRIEAKERVVSKQFEAACNGVVPMSIWWGKNYAGQSDKADITSAGEALKVVVERIGGKD